MRNIATKIKMLATLVLTLLALPACIERLATDAELNERIADHQGLDAANGDVNQGGDGQIGNELSPGQDQSVVSDDVDTADSGASDGSGSSCQFSSECNDNNACTDDTCQAGSCTHVPHTDGNPCLEGQVCGKDGCEFLSGAICGDGNVQGTEQCDDGNGDPGDGCSNCHLDVAEPLGMRFIPTGTFPMGCADGGGVKCTLNSDDMPVHKVELAAFFIDQTEVTADAYKNCVEGFGCAPPVSNTKGTYGKTDKAKFPVLYVNFSMAKSFCSIMEKRLCTEAEWEFAARGSDGRVYPWSGNSADCSLANMVTCGGAATLVGSYPAGNSPFGVQDMAGNVDEWVADYWGAYSSVAQENPKGPLTGSGQIARGGSCASPSDDLRSSARSTRDATEASDTLGFRCCKNL